MNPAVPDPPKGNILIVDDNPANLRLLIDILGRQGYEVRPVPNGKLALAAIRGLPPDLILLDIMMPEIDGYQVCLELKNDPLTRHIPVIFISAVNEVIDKVRAFKVGAVDYITKPFQIEEVLARVDTHLKICFLQKHLAKKTQSLTETIQQLKLTQDQLIYTEKMAALGQLIAGIAHEINTPMGAIRSSVENLNTFFEENLTRLPIFLQSVSEEYHLGLIQLIQNYARTPQTSSTREKRQFKRNIFSELTLREIEKADILADTLIDLGIYTTEQLVPFWSLLKSTQSEQVINIAYQLTTLQTSTKTIKIAAERAAKIVFALRSYARYEQTGELILTDLVEGIEMILTLYQNQLKQGVEVIRNYQVKPTILCYPDELNQVWTNLISNSLQAMENKGILTITVDQNNQEVQVSITDSGEGIPIEIQSKIFEPFFTTKLKGEGSGLGLDIVKKIIEKHRGKIEMSSTPQQTTFTVSLPLEIAKESENET